jgi:hypothetical protein
MEIETQWSIDDLADAHEMIEWNNASIIEAQDQAKRERDAARAGK